MVDPVSSLAWLQFTPTQNAVNVAPVNRNISMVAHDAAGHQLVHRSCS
ncbi:MAG: hypothetical protein VX702_04915 [Pseudomonadota bacterium]|nr:hypothetical protein [Pseudomonadota bacterium]